MSRRKPVELYEQLIAEAQLALPTSNRADARKWLGTLRRKAPDPRLLELCQRHDINLKYVVNHLLSIERWSEELRAAAAGGLPLITARKVAQRPLAVQRTAILQFEKARKKTSATRAAREVDDFLLRETSISSRPKFVVNEAGWMSPVLRPKTSQAFEGAAWLFPPLSRLKQVREMLHPWVAQAIVSTYSPMGGYVIDPMAGSGAIGQAASSLGRYSFSSDLEPALGAIHISQANIEDFEGKLKHLQGDLVVAHPPTLETWLQKSDATKDTYEDFLGQVLAACTSATRVGGYIVVVTRPGRRKGNVLLDTPAFASNCLKDATDSLYAHHVAVARDASEVWHIAVARKSDQ